MSFLLCKAGTAICVVGTFIDFIVFQIDESGVAEFRDETYFIHVCLLQLFKVSRPLF